MQKNEGLRLLVSWLERGRAALQPSGDGNGCGLLAYGFLILVALTFFKVAIETGNGLGFIFGLAIIFGLLKSNK
jgi:hypothetical protein